MSGIPQSRKLWITPLSPVHMGTDEDYTPTGYVIEGNALYEFDERALENLPEVERRALDKLLAGPPTQDMLKRVQAFFYKNRDWLISSAVNVVHVSDALAALYENRVGKAANIESGGKEVQNRLEIERAAYNPLDRRLILPGTGLKGAMRTALLDAVNNGQRTERGERNRELQQRLFCYTMRDLNKDPMRLVQVGDCAWRGPEQLNSAEILFAVNRKKHAVMKDGREALSQAEQRNLYQMLECAAPFRFRAFQGLLTVPDVSDLQCGDKKLPSMRFSFGEIATACNRFYRPIFEAETEMLHKRGFLDGEWRRTVGGLLDDSSIQQRLTSNDAFLLRVGRHSGAESVTLNGVRSVKIMQGKGERPKYEPEAKTIWLASGEGQDKRYLRPFGWLLVEMTEMNEELPAWETAEAIMERHNEQMSQWLDSVKAHQSTLTEKTLAEREQAEQKAREAAQREAEAERLKAEEEARQAKMSPLEREIEAICKQESNNPAAQLLNKLQAGSWESQEDQRVVAEKIRSLWVSEKRWIPDFSGTNKQKVKQRDRCVKVMEYLDKDGT